ncbi:capsid protein [Crucivirus-362]|nr:capsid protein [Crucivirus-362]
MPRLSSAHKQLVRSLVKQHASNAIVKRQVNRGIKAAKRGLSKYVKDPNVLRRDLVRGSNFVRAIEGSGDYKMHHGRGFSHGKMGHQSHRPHMRKLENGEMCISHSEYIGELVSGVGVSNIAPFTSQAYNINPANSGTFPWLSATAVNFQEYKFRKLIFEYRPLVSDSATTTTSGALTSMGSVIMATQYDSVLGLYVNKNTMENSDFSISCKPSEHARIAVECDPRFNPLGILYTNGALNNVNLPPTGSNANPANTDVRFQNLGIFQIASNLIPTNGATQIDLGEIWVHYEVELLKPQLNAGLTNLNSSHYNINSGVASATLIGAPTATSTNYMALTFPTTNSFAFPLAVTEGTYLCVYYLVVGTAVTATNNSPTVSQGTLVSLFNNTGGSDDGANIMYAPTGAATATSSAFLAFIVNVNAPGSALCTVTMPTNWVLTGTPQAELVVTPWNLSITN